MDAKKCRIENDENWEGDNDRWKPHSSKLLKHNNAKETEEHKCGRSSDEKNCGRKRFCSSSRPGSGQEDDYNETNEPSSKVPRKIPEERRELRLSGREVETGCKSRFEESDRNPLRKVSTTSSGHESSQSKTRSNMESPNDCVLEKVQEKGPGYPEKKDNSREKGHKHHEQERYPQFRRADGTESDGKAQEDGCTEEHDSKSVKASDHSKQRLSGDRILEPIFGSGEARGKAVDSISRKDVRSARVEERRDGDTSKSRSRSDTQDKDNRPVVQSPEARTDSGSGGEQKNFREPSAGLVEDRELNTHCHHPRLRDEKGDEHRQQLEYAYGSCDEIKIQVTSVDLGEDEHLRTRDTSGKEIGRGERSQTPERTERHYKDLDGRDQGISDNERNLCLKGKEREERYRVAMPSKGKDKSEIAKRRDFEVSKDQWKRSRTIPDANDMVIKFDHVKEKDSAGQEQGWLESEKFHRLHDNRRDTRIRPEDVNTSSTFVSENRNSDAIEIIPSKSHNFDGQEPFSAISRTRTEVGPQQDCASGMNDQDKMPCRGQRDDLPERCIDDCSSMDRHSQGNSLDSHGAAERKGPMNIDHSTVSQSVCSASETPFENNQVSGSSDRAIQQGPRGTRYLKAGRGRLSRSEAHCVGVPLHIMGPPFDLLGIRPRQAQPIAHNMSLGPSINSGVLITPFPGPLARGVNMNMLPVLASLPRLPPPKPVGTRFAQNVETRSIHGMCINQPGPGRGPPSNISAPGLNITGTNTCGKAPVARGPLGNKGPSGRVPSRGEQNDYSQNFVDSGTRPQNFIRELELTSVVEDYPKLRELIQKKDEIVANSASPPMYYKCNLHKHVLSHEFFGTKFDVILVDPPWEEYVHRAPGVTDQMEYWTFEEIQNLKIETISDTPSFVFLWVGDGVGLEQGRECLKKWGFRRCEDICWVKTNKKIATPGLRHDSHTLVQHSKEHCLMGIKGTVRRNIDCHVIHANIDTDVIIAEEPAYGSTKKPDEMYKIIEHFSLGRRRLELFGEDHNIRSGWLTVGKGLSSSNFNTEAYIRNFADKDGKVWQGSSGGRNPSPGAPHLVVTTPDIESLRPRTPPPKHHHQQNAISGNEIVLFSNNKV